MHPPVPLDVSADAWIILVSIEAEAEKGLAAMALGLLGLKVGMTQVDDDKGHLAPVTVRDVFRDVTAVDIIGTSKGRGTTGVMKRHNFHGLPASHGAKKVHRQAGSTASLASNRGSGRPKRGRRMAGRYGHERVTIRN